MSRHLKLILIIVLVVAGIAGGYLLYARHGSKPEISTDPVNGVKSPDASTASPAEQTPAQPNTTDKSVVKFSSDQAKASFASRNHLAPDELEPVPGLPGTYVVARPAEELSPAGATVSEQQVYTALLTPNDPIYPQWYSNKISAPSAWDTTTGSSSVTVAVIDTGFGLNHEDMANRWALNAGESGGGKESNGIDDDGNGFIDDWRGWDFISNDNSPMAGLSNPAGTGVNHGTITAGLVGATGNNAKGVASLNWGAKILPLQALSDGGSGTSDSVAAAMHYAVNRGVKVINLSLGSSSPDDVIKAEVDYAQAHDVVVIAAAGNCGDASSYLLNGCSSVGQIIYPANYAYVIAVGATDSNDNRASFSSYGSSLDLVAPGAGTLQAPNWSLANQTTLYTGSANGTSFAAPIVTGAAGLLRSISGINAAQVTAALINGVDKIPQMGGANFSSQYGYGRLNTRKALDQVVTFDPCLNSSNIAGVDSGPKILPNRFGSGQLDHLSLTQLNNTGSHCVEVHTWADSSYQGWAQHIATNLPAIDPADSELVSADIDGDGRDGLMVVNYRNTGSGMIEVHGWSSSLQTWVSHIASNRPAIDPADADVIAADTNGDGHDELILIQYRNTGSGLIEAHTWSSNMQAWVSHIASNHPSVNPTDSRVIGANVGGGAEDELLLIKYRETGSGRVEVHGWSGNMQAWVSHIATSQGSY